MSNVDPLGSVNLRELLSRNTPVQGGQQQDSKDKKADFGDTISEFIDSVNDKAREDGKK